MAATSSALAALLKSCRPATCSTLSPWPFISKKAESMGVSVIPLGFVSKVERLIELILLNARIVCLRHPTYGHTALTLIPLAAFSFAAVLVRPMTACLETQYGERRGTAVFPAILAIFTMLPPSTMRGICARRQLKVPLRFTSRTWSKASSVTLGISANVPIIPYDSELSEPLIHMNCARAEENASPALLTHPSILPNLSLVLEIHSST